MTAKTSEKILNTLRELDQRCFLSFHDILGQFYAGIFFDQQSLKLTVELKMLITRKQGSQNLSISCTQNYFFVCK